MKCIRIEDCETCKGSGIHREDHGQGDVESLGCYDCMGLGWVPVGEPVEIWPIITMGGFSGAMYFAEGDDVPDGYAFEVPTDGT